MARNPDPKPGRWILPLIIVGMVAFTYVFVNSLEDTAAANPVTNTSTTVTTSDIEPIDVEPTIGENDPGVQAYLDQLVALSTDLNTLSQEMNSINERWDNREVEFATARDFLRDDLNPRIAQWVTRVESAEVPAEFVDQHTNLINNAGPISVAAVAILDGLEAPDTGEARRAALEQFNTAVAAYADAASASVADS